MKFNRKKLIGKSKRTLDRIEEIHANIESYKNSIEMLHAFAEGRASLSGKGCTERAVQKFMHRRPRTKEDDERMQWTLKNIKTQMTLLEHELGVLLEYGA